MRVEALLEALTRIHSISCLERLQHYNSLQSILTTVKIGYRTYILAAIYMYLSRKCNTSKSTENLYHLAVCKQ